MTPPPAYPTIEPAPSSTSRSTVAPKDSSARLARLSSTISATTMATRKKNATPGGNPNGSSARRVVASSPDMRRVTRVTRAAPARCVRIRRKTGNPSPKGGTADGNPFSDDAPEEEFRPQEEHRPQEAHDHPEEVDRHAQEEHRHAQEEHRRPQQVRQRAQENRWAQEGRRPQEEERVAPQVQPRRIGYRGRGDEALQERQGAQRSRRQGRQGQEPQTGDRDRAFQSARVGQEGPAAQEELLGLRRAPRSRTLS